MRIICCVLVALALAGVALADTGTYEAHQRPAAELAQLVGFAVRGEGVTVTADEKSNRVILSGGQVALETVRATLADLDRAPERATLDLELTAGQDGGAPRTVWKGRLAVLSGVTGRVSAAGPKGLTLPGGGTLASVGGRFTATHVEGGWDVRAAAEVAVDAKPPLVLKLTGQARGKAGEPLAIGTARTGAGEVLGIVVTVR